MIKISKSTWVNLLNLWFKSWDQYNLIEIKLKKAAKYNPQPIKYWGMK